MSTTYNGMFGQSLPRSSGGDPLVRGQSPPRGSWADPLVRGESPPRGSGGLQLNAFRIITTWGVGQFVLNLLVVE